MIRLSSSQRFFISEDLMGFLDTLMNDGVFQRRVDFLMLGYSYAITHQLAPAENYTRNVVTTILTREDMKLLLEAMTHWYLEDIGYPPVENEKQLLERICELGIAGCRELRNQWEQKSPSQIEWDILTKIAP